MAGPNSDCGVMGVQPKETYFLSGSLAASSIEDDLDRNRNSFREERLMNGRAMNIILF